MAKRPLAAIQQAESEFFDKVWYDRHQLLRQADRVNGKPVDAKILKQAIRAATEIEKRHGLENLGPYSDFDWGMINGKLSALRWVLGEDWDVLDT